MSISTTQCSQTEFFTNPVDIHHSTSTKKEGCFSSGCYTIAYYHVIIQHMEFFQQSIQIVSSIFYTNDSFHYDRYKKSHITIESGGTTKRNGPSFRTQFIQCVATLEAMSNQDCINTIDHFNRIQDSITEKELVQPFLLFFPQIRDQLFTMENDLKTQLYQIQPIISTEFFSITKKEQVQPFLLVFPKFSTSTLKYEKSYRVRSDSGEFSLVK